MALDKSVGTQSLAMDSKKEEFKGKKLRVAIVGCGGICQSHMEAYKNIPEVEIVAGVDILPERLEVMESKWGLPKKALFKDWKVMLKKIKPDAVDVCTPNGVHAPAVIDALNAGCHAMTEKPMGMSVKECEEMVKVAKKNKRKLAVGFQQRYHNNTEFLVRARDEGQFGKIMFVKCRALRRRGIPNWGVFGQKELQGGGPMIDIGVHLIEVAHYFMGSPKPIAASGNIWTYIGDKPSEVVSPWPNWDWKTFTVEDLAIGQIRFDNGAIMQIETSFSAHIKEDVWNFTFMGDKGGGSWSPAEIYRDSAGTMINEVPGFLPESSWNFLFTQKLRNFVNACLNDTALRAPGEAGLAVQKILNGIYDSAAAGKEVVIK